MDCETKLPRAAAHRSFSIDSLLSNNYKNSNTNVNISNDFGPPELARNSFHYLEIESFPKDVRWKDCFQNSVEQSDYLDHETEFAQKSFDLVRHLKNIDYLPWISTRNVFDDAIIRSTNLPELEGSVLPPYSGLPLPFVYSSWLPVANQAPKSSEKVENNTAYGTYCRTSPRVEITDSDDSKSDSSRISDTPKDFSCPKQLNCEYRISRFLRNFVVTPNKFYWWLSPNFQ